MMDVIETQPGDNDLYAFLEALLRLEWPGRRVAVTPAPFPEVHDVEAMTALSDERWDQRWVLDVTVGPLSSEEPAWVLFRVVVWEEVARKDWLAVGAVVLRQAKHEFGLWALRGETRRADDQPEGPQSY